VITGEKVTSIVYRTLVYAGTGIYYLMYKYHRRLNVGLAVYTAADLGA